MSILNQNPTSRHNDDDPEGFLVLINGRPATLVVTAVRSRDPFQILEVLNDGGTIFEDDGSAISAIGRTVLARTGETDFALLPVWGPCAS